MTIGEQIKMYRKHKKDKGKRISQKMMADAIGLNSSKLSRIEGGVAKPTIKELNLICNYLEVRLALVPKIK